MSSDAEVENTPPIVGKHQEHIQYLEPDRRHNEEVGFVANSGAGMLVG
jgi:hypothetical protein